MVKKKHLFLKIRTIILAPKKLESFSRVGRPMVGPGASGRHGFHTETPQRWFCASPSRSEHNPESGLAALLLDLPLKGWWKWIYVSLMGHGKNSSSLFKKPYFFPVPYDPIAFFPDPPPKSSKRGTLVVIGITFSEVPISFNTGVNFQNQPKQCTIMGKSLKIIHGNCIVWFLRYR